MSLTKMEINTIRDINKSDIINKSNELRLCSTTLVIMMKITVNHGMQENAVLHR